MTAARVRPLLLALTLGLAACAGTPQTDRLVAGETAAGAPPLPVQDAVADVPFFPQEDYYCGPAALAMTLAWSGIDTTQHAIAEQIYTPGKQGTLRADVVGGARRHGRLAVEVRTLEGMLREIAAGHPVIVFQNLGLEAFPVWHFAVSIGYDLDAGKIVLHSGVDAQRTTDLSTFEHTWRRGDYWALVVLPPDTLPATADEPAVLMAAAGIERAGPADLAVRAYETIAARWPDRPGAWIGLGNVRYAQGDTGAAEAMFARAAEVDPGNGAAWNNLAVALSKRGRHAAARDAALRAIETGSGDIAEYRRTLAEVEAAAR